MNIDAPLLLRSSKDFSRACHGAFDEVGGAPDDAPKFFDLKLCFDVSIYLFRYVVFESQIVPMLL